MMLCSCATTNTHLKAWIDSHGRPQLCDLCGANGRPVVDTMLLAEHIDSVVAGTTRLAWTTQSMAKTRFR